MSKFNTRTSSKTVNIAGGPAYKQTDKLEFVSILLTSFLKDKFYESENETLERLSGLFMGMSDKKFAAKAALYARNEFGMRSVSHFVAAKIAQTVKGEQWTKSFFDKIVHRPDDMTEILAAYWQNTKAIPNSLKKGFAQAFQRFDEYQLAKYRKEGSSVSLVDIANLIHPKGNEALRKLMKGKLKNVDTWESKLSATKGDEKAKAQAWKELILEKKIGYFALLRNLRNILEQAPELIDAACELLVNEKMIQKSLVLPFRFITAIEQIENLPKSSKILVALNQAIDISLQNVPKFDGDTLVVLDSSGSMAGEPAKIGSLFSAVLLKSCGADFMTFSDQAEYQSINLLDSTLTIARSLRFRSGGTNFNAIFDEINQKYDRIIILSDMQGWISPYTPVGAFNRYKQQFQCSPKIYSFDLQGYGTLEFPEPDVFCLTGFSEKTLEIMNLLEKDKNALIHKIEAIDL